jgi:predicted RNase H-like HicB family nuclease
MTRYPAWIDGVQGNYGVSFPDLPGIVAMGATVDEALMHAEEALRDYVIEAERAVRRSRRRQPSNVSRRPPDIPWSPSH